MTGGGRDTAESGQAPSGAPVPPSTTTPAATARARSTVGRLLDLVPLVLAIVAEAAWIAVAGGLIAEYTLQEPHLGIGALALFVLAGVVAARVLAPAAGDRWPSVALLLVAIGGLIGWLSAPAARTALASVGVVPALGVNPAGWVAGIAVLRGFTHSKLPISAGTLATVFAVGVPSLAIAALAGGMIAEPHRARFLADATVAVIVFAGCSVVALAIARLTAVGAGSGFDWRRNPTWVALLVVLVLTTLAVAVPASDLSPVFALAAGSAVGPLLVVGLVLGFNRGTVRTVALAVAGVVLVIGLFRLLGSRGVITTESLGGGAAGSAAPPGSGGLGPVGLLVIVVAAMIVVLVLARLWSRRTTPDPSGLVEIRSIDHGDGSTNRPARRLRRRRALPEPVTAEEAYIRLLADIDRRPDVRRDATETPAAHAARLRGTPAADLSLDLLAADYALARFGGVDLSPAEERRALERWRRLRRSLGARA
ncbi:MAG TPA: DUF4129 domain-containing protein [Candidatus Limnocylindrales bacterium]|nr:DUF4129 domain-containing protein [Candidatus Limnocylindrales bacterium]